MFRKEMISRLGISLYKVISWGIRKVREVIIKYIISINCLKIKIGRKNYCG